MNRRNFLSLFGAGIAGIALEQAIPFNRVWSFPKNIVIAKPLIPLWDDRCIPVALQLEQFQAAIPVIYRNECDLRFHIHPIQFAAYRRLMPSPSLAVPER